MRGYRAMRRTLRIGEGLRWTERGLHCQQRGLQKKKTGETALGEISCRKRFGASGGESTMRANLLTLMGAVLIVLGIVAFTYRGIP